MPRRRVIERREPPPDPVYSSSLISRFINNLMHEGKKSVAERMFYGSLTIVEDKLKQDGLSVLKLALNNVKPVLEVKSRRVGGATYQVPMEVTPARQISLATRWIVQYADNRKGMPMAEALAQEIRDAAAGQGNAIKKREDTHKMAQANRAFAHFRW